MKQDSTDSLQLATILGGIALGAVAMYLADPEQGRRRRAMAQEKMRSMSGGIAGGALGDVMRDATTRLASLQTQASRLLGQRDYKPIDDHVLEARVRAKLPRFVSDAHRIDVRTDRGVVTLSGPVLEDERQHLLRSVEAIPGVDDVKDRLDAYDDRAGQRGSRMGGLTTAELMAALGGGLLGYYGITRKSPLAMALGATGIGLAARNMGGIGNLANLANLGRLGNLGGLAGLASLGNIGGFDFKRLFGMGAAAEPVQISKSIDIKAPPEQVFDVWSRYENFPHFMSHVVEVRDLGQRRSHWVVRGPAGANVEWDAVLTQSDRPTRLAWRSEPGATVENSGSVRLEPAGRNSTLATVTVTYYPPAGVLGQGIAMLLGSDPERQLEDDLARMKQFIERGAPVQDALQPTTTTGQILH